MSTSRTWRPALFAILIVIVILPVVLSALTGRGIGLVELGLWFALLAGWVVAFRHLQRKTAP